MKHFKRICFLILLLYALTISAKSETIVDTQKGILDLTNININNTGIIKIKGEWSFYWQAFIYPNDSNKQGMYVEVPFAWTNYKINDKNLPASGYATYKLKIILNKQDLNKPFAFELHDIATAFDAYINNEKVYSAGKIAKNREQHKPVCTKHIVPFVPKTEIIILTLHISNYNQHKSGIINYPKIGYEQQILKARDNALILDWFVIGTLLLIALYHIALYFLNRKIKANLFFGLFTIGLAFRQFLHGENYYNMIFDFTGWADRFFWVHFQIYTAVPLFLAFVNQLFQKEFPKRIVQFSWILSAAFLLSLIVLPSYKYSIGLDYYIYLTLIGSLYALIGLIIATIRKHNGAVVILIGFFIFFLFITNDLLNQLEIITTLYIASYGMVIFIFSQAYMLSARFMNTYRENEVLSKKLIDANETLEQKVKERTVEITQKNEELKTQTEQLEEINSELSKLSLVIEKTNNAAMIIGRTGRIEWVNNGFTRVTGFTKKQFSEKYGQKFEKIINNKRIYDLIIDSIAKQISASFEIPLFTRNSRKIWLQINFAPTYENEKLKNIVVIASDITTLKQAEMEIHLQKQELERQRNFAVDQKDKVEKKQLMLQFAMKSIEEKKQVLEVKNKEITDSIEYAKHIQRTIMPSPKQIKTYLPESMIYYNPKDIVSGDFYWLEHMYNRVLFSAVDCVGHGVPGAFMSIVGYNMLNQIVNEYGLVQPHKILRKLNQMIYEKSKDMQNESSSIKLGMDLVLCNYDPQTRKLEFSGVKNPLYYISNNQIMQIKSDRIILGAEEFLNYRFQKQTLTMHPGDVIYIFSDGFADQFGGKYNKKFKYKPFRELLLSIHNQPIKEQIEILKETFLTWKGLEDQVDDVIVFGVKF